MSTEGSAARTPDDGTSERTAYWDINDIQFHCRISRSTAWRLVRTDGFPPPVVLGKRSVVWPRDEVLDFMESRRVPGHYRRPIPNDNPTEPTSFTVRTIRTRSPR